MPLRDMPLNSWAYLISNSSLIYYRTKRDLIIRFDAKYQALSVINSDDGSPVQPITDVDIILEIQGRCQC